MPKSNFCINHEAIFSKNMKLALTREEVTKSQFVKRQGSAGQQFKIIIRNLGQ